MNAEEVKERLLDALSGHKELWEWIRKLDAGTGTYDDVSKIAEVIGDRIAVDVSPAYSAEKLEVYAVAGHDIVSEAGEIAQQNLNDAAGIGIKPMRTKFPKAKVEKLIEELAATEPDMIADELKDYAPSLMMGMVDDIVQYNADFQAKAGLKPVIVRTWSGSWPSHDTRHTDWCHDLAGTYEYGKEPKNVYARHKGCRCRVEYFPNKRASGKITALAKGEIDRDSVLWNTKASTLESRLRKKK